MAVTSFLLVTLDVFFFVVDIHGSSGLTAPVLDRYFCRTVCAGLSAVFSSLYICRLSRSFSRPCPYIPFPALPTPFPAPASVGTCRCLSAFGGICRYLSISVGACRYLPVHVGTCRCLSIYVVIGRYMSVPVGACRYLSVPVGTCRCLSVSVGICGRARSCVSVTNLDALGPSRGRAGADAEAAALERQRGVRLRDTDPALRPAQHHQKVPYLYRTIAVIF